MHVAVRNADGTRGHAGGIDLHGCRIGRPTLQYLELVADVLLLRDFDQKVADGGRGNHASVLDLDGSALSQPDVQNGALRSIAAGGDVEGDCKVRLDAPRPHPCSLDANLLLHAEHRVDLVGQILARDRLECLGEDVAADAVIQGS